ncbi:electron transporter SenC [Frankia sp. R43]|uniref:SCO family protein n=1 Tax=Frankia sp. R43 TaxID=269536 RepID=UPI0006CA2D1F|nr:SCO family protein [Frankia sp. R43]KPM56788.1 electron transporter SenC [Frankia sp. R43]
MHTSSKTTSATTPTADEEATAAARAGHSPGPRRKSRHGTGRPGRVRVALALGLAVSLGATLGACSSGGDGTGVTIVDAGGTGDGLHGVVPTERFAKPALGLTDTDGRPFDLRTRTQGKITLLFFGYTMCPDVCPTTMADIAAALSEVDRSVRDQVSVVFVSTDPERDTGEVLDRWLKGFDSSFIGVRGPFAKVQSVAESVGVPLEAPEVQADGSVLVTHGSQVIAFGRDNRARVLYLAGTSVADYIADLPVLTAEKTGTTAGADDDAATSTGSPASPTDAQKATSRPTGTTASTPTGTAAATSSPAPAPAAAAAAAARPTPVATG